MDTGDVYVVAVFSEETTDGGRVMAVPRNCVFGEDIAHNTFIGIFVVRAAVIAAVVQHRWIDIAVIKGIATIAVSVAGVVGRIRIFRIFVGSGWEVARVPTPPPWKPKVANKDDFIEMAEATKSIASIKVAVVETIKGPKARGWIHHWSAVHWHSGNRTWRKSSAH